jgi:hypothetical protein
MRWGARLTFGGKWVSADTRITLTIMAKPLPAAEDTMPVDRLFVAALSDPLYTPSAVATRVFFTLFSCWG